MKTLSTKELNKLSKQYIIDCIDSEPYDIETKTDKEKIKFLFDTFINEKVKYDKRKKSLEYFFTDWMQGLPTVFNIEFENYKILELAKLWGSIPQDATEKQEDKILDNYWNLITNKTFQLFKKHGVL